MSRLEFRDVNVHLGSGSKKFHAVKNINLDIPSGSVVGLVGESGSGSRHWREQLSAWPSPVPARSFSTVWTSLTPAARRLVCATGFRWSSKIRTRASTHE